MRTCYLTAGLLLGLLAVGAHATDNKSNTDSAAETPETRNGEIVFRHALDNAPLEFKFKPDQTLTEAVKTFHKTAQNPYDGQPEAIAEGKKIYKRLCVACHLEDGSGRIGPSLVDGKSTYKRMHTDKGKFEIIYAGGAGAMQAFGRRITQDEILKVMAYLETLEAEGGS